MKYKKYIGKYYVLSSDFDAYSNFCVILKIHSIRKIRGRNIFKLYYASKERLKDLKGTSDNGWSAINDLCLLEKQAFNTLEEAKLFANLTGFSYFIVVTDGLFSASYDPEIFEFLDQKNDNE